VREAGAWKIRLLTVAPKTEPNAVTARTDAVAMSVPRAEPAAASVARPEPVAPSVPRPEAVATNGSHVEPAAASAARTDAGAASVPRPEAVVVSVPRPEAAATNAPRKEAAAVSVARVEAVPAGAPRIEAVATNVGPELKPSVAATPIPENKKPVILISIDKSKQRMTVSLDGVETFDWPVSTGRAGYSTPSGNYTATSMNEIWYSRQWDNAPMPHSVFFMKDGHAIHGSNDVKNLGKPASHGCVRISPENATTLYALVGKSGLENTHVVLSVRYARRRVQGRRTSKCCPLLSGGSRHVRVWVRYPRVRCPAAYAARYSRALRWLLRASGLLRGATALHTAMVKA
jgi:lipoprotein-anchoring transpeptidase ErfK/SrfK